MFRNILGAVVGYVVMAALAILAISLTWFGLGAEFAFKDSTLEASAGWSSIMLVSGLVAAVIGGLTANAIGRPGTSSAKILIGIVLVLGAVSAFMQLGTEVMDLPPGTSVSDLAFSEAGQYARSPLWYTVLIPLVGAFGVWLGGLRGRADPASQL